MTEANRAAESNDAVRRRLTSLALVAPLACLVCSCPSPGTGDVVFGVTSDLRPGSQLTRLEALLTLGGAQQEPQVFEGSALEFPLEIRASSLEQGTSVGLELRAFQGNSQLLERTAQTEAIADRALLVRASLDLECAVLGAPRCDDGTTCASGVCVDPFVSPDRAEEYAPDWAGSGSGDRCEPGGDPEVTVGEGQADYLDFDEGDTLQVEAGPQGGYHVWIAARLRNLKQAGSIIELSGRALDLSEDLPSLAVAFSFDPDEGGWCKIFGLRFRLDDADTSIETLLGTRIAVTVTITDPDGDVGTATKEAILSDDIR